MHIQEEYSLELEELMFNRLGSSWYEQLERFIISDEFDKIREFLINRSEFATIYPPPDEAYNAFKYCPFPDTKVVIMGQDPYHDGSANGLAFSSFRKIPPSLRIILTALKEEIGLEFIRNGNLIDWAQQGVLLLNTSLSVERGSPNSHKDLWKDFIHVVINTLKLKKQNLVWMCWGEEAKRVVGKIPPSHLLLESVHPAATIYNKKLKFNPQFNMVNIYLESNNLPKIDWVGYDNDLPF